MKTLAKLTEKRTKLALALAAADAAVLKEEKTLKKTVTVKKLETSVILSHTKFGEVEVESKDGKHSIYNRVPVGAGKSKRGIKIATKTGEADFVLAHALGTYSK